MKRISIVEFLNLKHCKSDQELIGLKVFDSENKKEVYVKFVEYPRLLVQEDLETKEGGYWIHLLSAGIDYETLIPKNE